MKKRTIFRNQSQEILALFESAKDRSKVMCIPIDYAKKDHIVMFCNGNGRIIRKPFSVKNTPQGKQYLIKQVLSSGRRFGIRMDHVFMGGEDLPSYSENFIQALRSENWLVASVNAHDAKKQRENVQASTDRLDLMAIAKMLLNCRGTCNPAQTGPYKNLRMLVRHRRRLVKSKTETKNRIHAIIDKIFPGFLDKKKSGILPFSDASIWLMKDRFSPQQIRRRKTSSLKEALIKQCVKQPEKATQKLQKYAKQVIEPQNETVFTLQTVLTHEINHLICLKKSICCIEQEMAKILAQTQGAFLTSIKGTGITLAAGISGEIGDPIKQKSLCGLVSYAGIIPKIKQTGGEKGQTKTGKVARRCNRILKDYVVQSAKHMGKHGPEDLMYDYKRRDLSGQHAQFGIARRYLRMAMCLMKTSQTYLPKHLRNQGATKESRAEYYLKNWLKLHEKWRKHRALDIAFDKKNPLGLWRNMIQELYGIKLTL